MFDEMLDIRLKLQADIDEKVLYLAILSDVKGIKYSAKWLDQQLVHQGYSWLSIPSSVHQAIEKYLSKTYRLRLVLLLL